MTEYRNSTLTREVAEIAVVEYADGVFQNELLEIMGDIKIAEAELALAEDELKQALDSFKGGTGGDLAVGRRNWLTSEPSSGWRKHKAVASSSLSTPRARRLKR